MTGKVKLHPETSAVGIVVITTVGEQMSENGMATFDAAKKYPLKLLAEAYAKGVT